MWTKSNKNYGDYIFSEYSNNDGNNGNLGLNLNISNNTSNVIFGSNNTASIGNNIFFDYKFTNKSLNCENEHLIFLDTKGSEVTIQFIEDDWKNLNASWFIISEGSLSMIHKYQTIKENENFKSAPNIKYFGTPEYCWEFQFLSTSDKINNVARGKHQLFIICTKFHKFSKTL